MWPDDKVRSKIKRAQELLDINFSGGRLVSAVNIHVTLCFIGNLKPSHQAAIPLIMSGLSLTPTNITFDKIGWWAQSRVIWLGTKRTPKSLMIAAHELSRKLGDLGCECDPSELKAHVTLARNVSKFYHVKCEPIVWSARYLALAASRRRSKGARYDVLYQVDLVN